MNTHHAADGLWCRWSTQDEALDGPPAPDGTGRLPADAPSWREREHRAGRRLLAGLLDAVLPHPVDRTIETAANGKPVLRDAPHIGVSISHSHPLVAVAVGIGWDVGVDVQLPPAPTPGGSAWPPERLWAWTVREACVKATGAGLSGRPWRIPVNGVHSGTWQDLRWRSLRAVAPAPLSVAWRPHTRTRHPSSRTEDHPS
ncbi:4'-phosphopantetheinyl transferase family protein [Spirillospora sp. CA-253888]